MLRPNKSDVKEKVSNQQGTTVILVIWLFYH